MIDKSHLEALSPQRALRGSQRLSTRRFSACAVATSAAKVPFAVRASVLRKAQVFSGSLR